MSKTNILINVLKTLAVYFSIFVLITTSFQNAISADKLAFSKAVEMYESTGYESKILNSKIKESEADVSIARSSYYPQIDMDIVNAFPRTRGAIVARQALYEAGAIDARIDAAKSRKDIANFNLKLFRIDGFAEFADQYFKVLELQYKKFLYETKFIPIYISIANKIEQSWKHQLVSLETKSLAEIEQSNQEIAAQTLEIEYEKQRLILGQMLGVEPETIFLDEKPIDEIVRVKKFTAKSILARSSTDHPSIRISQFKRDLADAERRAGMAPELPKLFANAVYALSTNGKGKSDKQFVFALNLNIPLFHGLVSFDKRKKYAEVLAQAEQEQLSNRYNVLSNTTAMIRQNELALQNIKKLSLSLKVVSREWVRAQGDFQIGNPATLGSFFAKLDSLRTAEENLISQRLLANKTSLILERLQDQL